MASGGAEPADPEVILGKSRFGKRYSTAYKLRILAEADRCTQPGEIGRLLRQEGILHATLTAFRKQRAAGQLVSPEPSAKRIRKPSAQQRGEIAENARRVMQLERENRRLSRQLEQAQAVIEVQKKVSRLLELSLGDERESS